MVQSAPSRSVEGAFHERHETRSGMRQPCVRQTRRAQGTGSSRATPRHCARRRRWSVPPVALEQTCNAPRAERRNLSAVRSETIAHALSHFAHEAAGLAESPAFRAPFSRAGMRDVAYGVPRAAKNRGGGAMVCRSASAIQPGGEGRERSERGGGIVAESAVTPTPIALTVVRRSTLPPSRGQRKRSGGRRLSYALSSPYSECSVRTASSV